MSAGAEFELEGHPADEQKHRLEDFLSELMLISRKYGILLVDHHETLQFLDLRNRSRLIGMGLVGFTDAIAPDKVLLYLPADSILDGAWEVDTDMGSVEQHTVMNVFPWRQA